MAHWLERGDEAIRLLHEYGTALRRARALKDIYNVEDPGSRTDRAIKEVEIIRERLIAFTNEITQEPDIEVVTIRADEPPRRKRA